MTLHSDKFSPDDRLKTIVKVAILAVGGQGGGVLTNWIESVARANGYAAQATSVAGVAQRTGATLYYIEMAPNGATTPVFSLAPSAGDVDVMIAAEMMEAGRAIMRGFVTPDRTTLIASTHRALAVSEKMVPGDGIVSSEEVHAAAEIAAEKLIMFDMDGLAVRNGSVISSSLLGALAASGALPFKREAFEAAIRASGKGVDASLRAFAAAFDETLNSKTQVKEPKPIRKRKRAVGPRRLIAEWDALVAEAKTMPAADMITGGLQKVVQFQNIAYGRSYLNRVKGFAAVDAGDGTLVTAAAKYIANAMAYDDVIRVADLKTRADRFTRIEQELDAKGQPVYLTEFMHPRGEEIISLLPASIGSWISAKPKLMDWIDRRVNRGRRFRTHRLSGFLPLYAVASLRRMRLRSLRHRQECEHMNAWLSRCEAVLPHNPNVAIELLMCRRLVKGYSDTHSRGLSKFDRVMEASDLVIRREDAADWIKRLREAALMDEEGAALDGAVQTIKSFA